MGQATNTQDVCAASDAVGDLPQGAIAEIVLSAVTRTCLSCGAKEAADGSLPCNH
ncbi:hypothetical protein [Burkholderia gladioli]|uniref:hypothetical protein n=1 Tax=Burkholderia gladioli TaxID=28095 RepID=UPI00164116DF|nr:hypothetical protein [Burkholderia gladioli]